MDMKRTFKSERMDFHAKIYGVHSYCYAQDMGDVVLLRVHNSKALYGELLATTGTVGICLILLAVLLAMIIVKYLDKKIVQGIYDINRKLTVITEGNFDETVDVDVTPEFKELSNYINIMINSILSTTDKISNILNKAMLPLGIYEYNDKMTRVRATDYINKILPLSDNNVDMFEECINSIKNNPVEGHNNVFMIEGEEPVYVMLEEFKSGNETMGMLMDVTENVKYDIKLKNERDRDVLTGLYNRRGLENRLDKLFETTDNLGHSAMVMIDSDGLKMINDTYGHRNGDTYLLKVRDVINEVRPANSIFARQGGDEFILFIYGCQTEKELQDYIQLIENQRDRMVLSFDNQEVKVRYSMGYAFFKDQNTDYEELIREADDNMYVDKKSRKKQA
jgi:diguanylate cyclase (GGDEF)-like protein